MIDNSRARPRVIVVGAGIAGLTCAYRLQRAGFQVTVLEKAKRPWVGGRMATVEIEGFFVDVGATLLMTRYRQMLDLIADAGLTEHVLAASDLIGIARQGRLEHIHVDSLSGLLRGLLHSSLPTTDLLRILSDFRKVRPLIDWYDASPLAARDGESVRDYAIRSGVSVNTYEYFLEPVSSCRVLAEPEKHSALGVLSFINLVIAGGGFFTSDRGAGFLPQGLARELPVEYQAEALSVEDRGGHVEVTWSRPGMPERSEHAEACVIATAPAQMLPIYQQLADAPREFFSSLEYSRSLHVALGLSRPTEEQAIFFMTSRVEHPDIVGFVLNHNMAPGRVPAGKGLVMAYLRDRWARENWHADDETIIDHVIAGANRLGVLPELRAHQIMGHVLRVEPGLVIRRPGDFQALSRIAPTLASRRVQFAGGEYLGDSSTNHSVCAGERVAQRLITTVGRDLPPVAPVKSVEAGPRGALP